MAVESTRFPRNFHLSSRVVHPLEISSHCVIMFAVGLPLVVAALAKREKERNESKAREASAAKMADGKAGAFAPAAVATPSPRTPVEATRQRLVAAAAAAPASSNSQIMEETDAFIWHRVDMDCDTLAGLALRYRTTKTNIKRYNGAPSRRAASRPSLRARVAHV